VLLAALKIESSLPAATRQHCNTVFCNISVRPEPQVQMDLLDEMFSSLQEAMVRKTTIKLHYDLSDGKEVETDLEPYHLFYGDYGWYVIGKSSFHKSIRTFKLSSIKALEVLNKCFGDGHDFDIHEYFGKAWLMKPEGRLYNIKLRFSPQVARTVAQVQWHRTQTVTKNNDGSAIIEFRVDGLGEITWWILSYGDQVQVLAPKILRENIAKIATNIMHSSKST
jgi:proteasome accessory factor B